jgi:transposase-like protein
LQGWKKQKSQHGDRAFVGSGHSYASVEKTPGEIELERENNELRRANEILKDALANLDLQFCVAPLGSMINRPRLQTPSIT